MIAKREGPVTPQEIFEHKQRWMRSGNNHPVHIHSDLRTQAKEYCKVQMFPSQWTYQQYMKVYQDTFFFEHHQDAKSFCNYFKKWVDIGS